MWGLWIWSLVAIAGAGTGGYNYTRYEYQWVYHTSFKTEKRCLEVGNEVAESKHLYRSELTKTNGTIKCRKLD